MTKRTYSETVKHENCTIVIHRPELSETEREKRMDTIKKAAESLLKATHIHKGGRP